MRFGSWGLAFVLLGAPAQSAPRRDFSEKNFSGKKDGPDASSILLKATKPGDRFYDAPQLELDRLPPGLAKLAKRDDFPPELAKKDDFSILAPGLVKKDDYSARQPGLSMPDEVVEAVPEPTGLVLFGSGLLLARAAGRRRRGIETAPWQGRRL
jgi:hypothetical protein